jgi:phosphoribosyl 1,2-cyclic phosphate phosphodiesterase
MEGPLDLPQGTVECTRLPHGRVETLGLVFTERSSGRKLAYYTDCKTVTPAGVALARGADLVVLDGLRPQDHPTHMTIAEAVEKAAEIGCRRTLLTHMTHQVDHALIEAELPETVRLAYDGLRVTV